MNNTENNIANNLFALVLRDIVNVQKAAVPEYYIVKKPKEEESRGK